MGWTVLGTTRVQSSWHPATKYSFSLHQFTIIKQDIVIADVYVFWGDFILFYALLHYDINKYQSEERY